MPLHIICQCCKCKSIFILHLWTISINHKYANESKYICCHFDVKIDHESNIGFFGLGWSNHIIIEAFDKNNNEKKIIIDHMFNDKFTEYQNFVIFSNKIVFHARISDFEYKSPNMGFEIQKIIDYNEILEKKRISLIN